MLKLMFKHSLVALALALGACSSTAVAPSVTMPPGPTLTPPAIPLPTRASDPLSQLAQFTVADLMAASKDAHAQQAQPGCTSGDCTAYTCYDYLIQVIPTLPTFSPSSTLGAFIAFQKLRDLSNGVSSANGQLASINRACAPLVIDTQTTINKLLLIGAGTAATAGAAGPVLAPLVAQ